ncbi:MAG TPA: MarC family protein [Reyranella sp.]|jgi:multiple antibiotic resistance protein
MTVTPAYVFTIFMVTVGPIKVIPAFATMVKEATREQVIALAVRGALQSTAIALFIAIGITGMQASWGVSLDAIRIAGGILLFMSAAGSLLMQAPAAIAKAAPPDEAAIKRMAFMPLSIPTIITPWGVVAILLFMRLAHGDRAATVSVLAVLLLVMALNFVGMLFARRIMKVLGIASFQLMGWIFGILQCGLAVETILLSLQNLGVLAK